jgi:hypothetical protein
VVGLCLLLLLLLKFGCANCCCVNICGTCTRGKCGCCSLQACLPQHGLLLLLLLC